MKPIAILAAILTSLNAGSGTSAEQPSPLPFTPPGDASGNYTVATVITGLDRPCGLAIRPGWSENVAAQLYLVERGRGRILKMETDAPGVTQEVIGGFPAGDAKGTTTGSPTGEGVPDQPLDLLFLTHSKLVVCCRLEDGRQLLNVYRLPTRNSALTADETDHQAGPCSSGSLSADDQPRKIAGWFCGLAKSSDAVLVAAGGGSQGWILKAPLEANRLSGLQKFIATTKQTGRVGPAGILMNPNPRLPYLLVGQMGRIDVSRDSGLAFYSPKSGRLAMHISTGLHDLVDLSYSQPEGHLYGIDLAWQAVSDGGVYRLDDALLAGKPTCQAMKIAPVQRPTSMAFGPDGSLYVTAWGPARAETNANPGQQAGVLLKISGQW